MVSLAGRSCPVEVAVAFGGDSNGLMFYLGVRSEYLWLLAVFYG